MSINVANTNADLSGKTLVTSEGTSTVTGLKTFDRDPSAPFAVTSGSAVVTNLDADKVDGLDALQWTSYVPTVTNFTTGDGTVTGQYARLGSLVFFRVDIILGSSSAVTGAVTVSYPVTAAAATGGAAVGFGEAIDTGTGGSAVRCRQSTTSVFLPLTGNAAQVNTTSPHTWATGDELHLTGFYVAA